MAKAVTEEITVKSGIKLLVEKRETDDRVEIYLQISNKENRLLHWGLLRNIRSSWQTPPQKFRPNGSRVIGRSAVQTPFTRQKDESSVVIRLDKGLGFSFISFALYYPDNQSWDNNHGKNYYIEVPAVERPSPYRVLKEELNYNQVYFEKEYCLEPDYRLAAALIKEDDIYKVFLVSDIPGSLVLHWGIALSSRCEWRLPPVALHPDGTKIFNDNAVDTPFLQENGLNRLTLQFKEQDAPPGISFVLRQTETDSWLKDRGRNFYIPISYQEEESPGLSHLTEEIIDGEMGDHSWTLMHRFNLCYDLLDRVKDMDGLALLFVWLRFSEIRQLDWQRRYNTKPGELSHAQDRLTLKLADLYSGEPDSREFIRLMMTSLGRGGEGQKIRDEILRIMHRHHIKEVAGHFMEEWHQKLHNNTTPDDIVICEAFLKFLKSDGDRRLFYRTLEEGGVTRKRLESFERPIVTEPDFIPDLKDKLIHDFENYLRLLNSVHSGTDLESAVNSARYLFDDKLRVHMEYIWRHRDDRKIAVADTVEMIIGARRILSKRFSTERDSEKVRDILYLDLALEEFLRVVIERSIHEISDGDQLVELAGMALENFRLSYYDDELSECFEEWMWLEDTTRFTRDWSLHAKAVLDRLNRATEAFVDRYYKLLQPKAEYLGKAFHADSWTITLFTEEVVRGRPAFVLSMLIHHLDPLLRKKAKLGDWQVISPGHAVGRLEVVDSLRSVQGRSFESPSVVVAERIRGDEEPPEGVTAVITPDAVDLVSHVAVRARNSHLLFATCYDRQCFERLKSLRGHVMKFTVNTVGDVLFEEVAGEAEAAVSLRKVEYVKRIRPEFSAYAVSLKDFDNRLVGGKSNNLTLLEGRLPDWIHLPASVALPFGVFEEILSSDRNREISGKYHELLRRIPESPGERLAEIRKTLLALEAPDDLMTALRKVMEDTGLGWPDRWDDAWLCIKRVWASRWNERAYLSRNERGIPHEDIFMAVLIQPVVDAEYSFVIHTINPFTNDRNELYAEVVPGLGETLVGNYPGRALSFTFRKDSSELTITAYPSKSAGLYGGGLIFRSDSSAEDLPGYAGAGLYDSVMLESPREVRLNYTKYSLVWNEGFKEDFLTAVARTGIHVEKNFGYPQDIEGAYTKGEHYVVQTRPQVGIENG